MRDIAATGLDKWILYEDSDILVCVKPAGIATETKRIGRQDMVSVLRNYRNEKGESTYIGLVHRLDQPVEGILVFGKNQASTAKLCAQLASGNFSKNYLAVTEGAMPLQQCTGRAKIAGSNESLAEVKTADNAVGVKVAENIDVADVKCIEGILEDYLVKDKRTNLSRIASADDPRAKKAVLLYRVLQVSDCAVPMRSLVKIKLLTGRHHQIRVQMAHFGTPLAGDRKYGTQKDSKGILESGLGLCAYELEFVHPATYKKVKFAIVPSQPVFDGFIHAISQLHDTL